MYDMYDHAYTTQYTHNNTHTFAQIILLCNYFERRNVFRSFLKTVIEVQFLIPIGISFQFETASNLTPNFP